MSGPIHLFISSSPELDAEREVASRAIAALPLTIGWRIGHTPLGGQGDGGDFRVEQCDLYVLILGQDFAAPMGYELRQAVASGKRPLAYRKNAGRSPSAQDAVRRLDLEWREFATPQELRSSFERELVRAMLQRAGQLDLDMNEVERLSELAQEAERKETENQSGGRRGEAGRSGVILGREVWESGT